jgi:hypothetical protein
VKKMGNQKVGGGMNPDSRTAKGAATSEGELTCGVLKDNFPASGKCYSKTRGAVGSQYKTECKHCGLWASLPDSVSLKVTHILECSLYGYAKRITE